MTKTTAIVRDDNQNYDSMAIVEKYESFLDYAYPRIQKCPRRHGVVRDAVLSAILAPVSAFYAAGKSRQLSRLYAIDADLATIRFWLRFMAHPARQIISPDQCAEAMSRLAEVGKMLGRWMTKLRSEGRESQPADSRKALG